MTAYHQKTIKKNNTNENTPNYTTTMILYMLYNLSKHEWLGKLQISFETNTVFCLR